MKTLDQAIQFVNNRDLFDRCMDGRDMMRLAVFVPTERLHEIKISEVEGIGHIPKPWTRENILAQLQEDVAFGFEKALGRRGISSELMFIVVLMWNNFLEEGLENYDPENYPMYGLPLFKATAVKYGFPNPIGDDTGSEEKYEE